jgi:hypothetical protein
MKYVIFFLLFSFACCSTFAQLYIQPKPKPKLYSLPKTDSTIAQQLWLKQIISPLIKSGNNKMGFDIYKAALDSMAVLKPDSTFQSGMPVVGYYH